MRHQLLVASCAIGLASAIAQAAAPEQVTIDTSQIKTLASGLRGVEGPSALPDGSAVVMETQGGAVVRVNANGTRDVLATPGSGIAGSVVGRDGALYVTRINLGRLMNGPRPPGAPAAGPGAGPGPGAGGPPPGGGMQGVTPSPAALLRIDLKTGAVKELYTRYQGALLKEPNDLIADEWGDLWFTDTGDEGSVYWARSDGSDIKLMITDVKDVNGIAMAPDRRSFYIAGKCKLQNYTITGRGQLKQENGRAAPREVATLDPQQCRPDGMKTEANGDILLAGGNEGIFRYSPKGDLLSQAKFTGVSITNFAFGGKDGRTLYLATRAADRSGNLQSVTWPRRGATFR
jgi:gluconolactonase